MSKKMDVPENWFMAPFGGLDRTQLDPDPEFNRQRNPRPLKKGWAQQPVRTTWLRDWYRFLYGNSNFHFTGLYLNADNADPKLVTSASRTDHHWTQNWLQIQQQGWGIWPIYQGFSNSGPRQQFVKLTDDWDTTSVARGVAAAKHIAAIVATLPGDNTGMVVYIDNEAGTTTRLVPYYKALFRELQTNHPDGRPALRAGLYIQDAFIRDVLRELPDLYIWRLDIHDGDLPKAEGNNPRPTPIDQTPSPGPSRYQRFQIGRYPITRGNCFYLPVGRQCTLVGRQQGNTRSVIFSTGEGISASVSDFDFDVSFVRDPRYPQADPRFVCTRPNQLIYSTFEKSGVKVAEVGSQASLLQSVEGEAPLFSIDQELYVIGLDGSIDISTKKTGQTTSQWDKPTTVVPAGDLRRIRTFTVLRTAPKETRLFYISRRYSIQTYTRVLATSPNTRVQWTKSETIVPSNLHPFSDLAAALFKSKVYLFFTQSIPNESIEATLCAIPYPSSTPQQLTKALKATSVAAVALTNYILLFYLARDCQLSFITAHIDPQKPDLQWTPPMATTNTKLHPHTHLSVCTITSAKIKVAAISAAGEPTVYDVGFIYGSAAWSSSGGTSYKRNEDKEFTGPMKGFASAKGWSVNPYGDIALVRNSGSTELYCAGAAPGMRGILLRRLDKDEPWVRLADVAMGGSP
jgi:hypothetical protein